MTRITKLTTGSLQSAINTTIEVLKEGGIVVYPTDTVYGLLVDATNLSAVQKLIQFKNRAPGKAISMFIAHISKIEKYVKISEMQQKLLKTLLPGPYTIVLPSKNSTQKLLESEKGTLGIRVPIYDPISQLTTKYKNPITATSANLGGKPPHYSIESFLKQIPKGKQDLIDLIVDAGKLKRNKPSTVIDMSDDAIKILRKGDAVFEQSINYISQSAEDTQNIGRKLMKSLREKSIKKPYVIVLRGDLGSGKTEMTRGIASVLNIQNIISPTFVVYYEYEIPTQNSRVKVSNLDTFIHADLYNIQEEEEFDHLGLENYLKPGNIMVIEWGEKLGTLFDAFKRKAEILFIDIEYTGENSRNIIVQRYIK